VTTIQVQVEEAVYREARRRAEAEGRTVEAVSAELLASYAGQAGSGFDGQSKLAPDSIIGMWADDPESVDQMLESAMRWRRERNQHLMGQPPPDDEAST
jgi:hypothetical protein